MSQFELEIVFVGVGTESDFFNDGFRRLGFDLFFPLLFVVDEFLKVRDFADGRFCFCGNLNEIEIHFFSPGASLSGGINAGFDCFSGDFADIFKVISN